MHNNTIVNPQDTFRLLLLWFQTLDVFKYYNRGTKKMWFSVYKHSTIDIQQNFKSHIQIQDMEQ